MFYGIVHNCGIYGHSMSNYKIAYLLERSELLGCVGYVIKNDTSMISRYTSVVAKALLTFVIQKEGNKPDAIPIFQMKGLGKVRSQI